MAKKSKIAFVFPGQGAQVIGMGKEFYDSYCEAREVYEIASKVSGLAVEEICFYPNETINCTEYTQIAILSTEIAILKVLESKGIKADVCAGLSLGEYAALAAAKVMDISDLLYLIRQRGILMQDAYPIGGAMAAILGLEATKIQEICEETEGIVSIANYNCPGQIVITGQKSAVDNACDKLQKAGAKRCIPLNVSGPFHSELMEKASLQLAQELQEITIETPSIPYISNVEATLVESKEEVKELLVKQICDSVYWTQSGERMIEMRIKTFIEIGPGKTLSNFIKKISKEVRVYSVESLNDMEVLLEEGIC